MKHTSLFAVSLAACIALGSTACVKESDPTGASTSALTGTGKAPFTRETAIVEPPEPKGAPDNPLAGAKLFVDPESNAMGRYKYYDQVAPDPAKAALLGKIAFRPQALWMGEWNSDIFRAVEHLVERAQDDDSVAVMIAYNIPNRDCGQHSRGGLSSKEAYQRWIRNVARGIGSDPAVVVLEPDALGHFQECLSEEQKAERMFLLNDAVRVLRENPGTSVYLDAGHARWVPAAEMAERLKKAGIEHANGFSLNTSNYVSTQENLEYGKKLSALLGGKHFVIDTSRNGAGPYEQAATPEEAWCNPPGRKLGTPPTTETGEPLCDGFLWLKRPGESDGECRGGPRAGVFWDEIAFEQAG
jgi:endoglucanase